MRDEFIEKLIEQRQIERLLEDHAELPVRKPFLPLDEWLKLKNLKEQHRLNATKRKLQKLRN